MIQGFRDFLIKQNFLALALAVVIGTAASKVVTAIVEAAIMPVLGLVLPGGGWRDWKIVLRRTLQDGEPVEQAVALGQVVGAVLDFLIIAFVVYLITRALVKSPPPPDTRTCSHCRETVAAAADRCRFCTSALEPQTVAPQAS